MADNAQSPDYTRALQCIRATRQGADAVEALLEAAPDVVKRNVLGISIDSTTSTIGRPDGRPSIRLQVAHHAFTALVRLLNVRPDDIAAGPALGNIHASFMTSTGITVIALFYADVERPRASGWVEQTFGPADG